MLLALVATIVCSGCHPAIVARYAAHPMARTSGLVDAAAEPSGEFFHKASGTRFEIVKSNARLELDWNRRRQPLDFFIGSRRMGRSYGFIENGYFYQAPVGYYANRSLWDMAPGYENDRKPDFNRPITSDCLFCHASGATPVRGTINRFADTSSIRGITCERCHGDASVHLSSPQKGNIVNPKKLAALERNSVCEQCHLAGEARFPKPNRRITDFRPGERLSSYLAVFIAGGERSGIRVNGHAEALFESRCRQASGERLWCGTCHDPHGAVVDYRAKCLGCHVPASCPTARKQAQGREADCVGCHMPKAKAYDGGHTVFTDHSIPRRAPRYATERKAPDSIRPYYEMDAAVSPEKARDWGIAWMQIAENYALSEAIEKAWPALRSAASLGRHDALLYTKIAEALDASGRSKEALSAYEEALRQNPQERDPQQHLDVLIRLAALYERSGDRDNAAAARKRAAAILPRLPY